MTRVRIFAAPVIAAALVAAGCGGNDEPDSSAATEWADGLCSAVSTWTDALGSTASTIQDGGLSRDTLESAVDDAVDATRTFVDDVEGLGAPETEAGQTAKESLDKLGDELSKGADEIESAAEDASGVSGILTAVSVASSTLVEMGSELTSTLSDIQGLEGGEELRDAFSEASSCDGVVPGS
jgi:hypothetical protein